jgi:hypothetical protein
MAKRGRTPKGQFADKLSHFSTRIQPATRKALEREAKLSGQSISQVAERLLVGALAERHSDHFGPTKRAMAFLIGQIAYHIEGIHHHQGKGYKTPFNWKNDPFFYEAFKIAVGIVLEGLSPPGKIEAPKISAPEGLSKGGQRFLDSFKSPKARGEYVGDLILYSLTTIPSWPVDEREQQQRRLDGAPFGAVRDFYAMPDVLRDLARRSYKSKRVVELSGGLFTFGQEGESKS